MKYVFPRARTVESTLGHVLFFEKNVPQHVPPELIKEILAAGGEPADDAAEAATDDASKPKSGPAEPVDPNDRAAKLAEAIALVVEGGQRESFTAGGAPHIKVLADLLGWKPSPEERDAAWLAFQGQKG